MPDTSKLVPEQERRLRRASAELRARLRAHLPCRVEEILSRDAELAASHEAVLELVYTEWATREELGEKPEREELFRRFPTLAERLERLFQVHDGIHGAKDTHDNDDRATWVSGKTPGRSVTPEPFRYEVLEELGRGGMGIVFKARQVALDRCVALKRILEGEYADEDTRARFRVEAEAAARLQHPNVVQIYEVGEDDGHPYLAMEYVAGTSLAERLQQGPLPPQAAAELVETLARTVQHAHDRGVIHRDLKPANVLLTVDGIPKISDFGLARQVDAKGRTLSGAVMGTPSYMAPEQTGVGGLTSPALDIYSLGAILYEAVCGRPPFLGATPMDTLLQVRTQDATPPRQLQPSCPRDLETICLKCLGKEPKRRYASALALAEDLHRFLDGRPIEARRSTAAERVVKWARRRPVVAALSAGLAVGAVISLTIFSLLWVKADEAVSDRQNALNDLRTEQKKVDYHKNFVKARDAWTADDLNLARQLLDECDPDLRDDEWQRLHRASQALRHVWKGLKYPMVFVAFAPDNQTLVAWGNSGGYVMSLTAPDRPPVAFTAAPPYYGQACTCDGQAVFLTFLDRDNIDLKYCSLINGKELRTQSLKELGDLGFARLSPDAGRLALVRFNKKEIEVVDLRGGPSHKLALKCQGAPLPLDFSADGRWLVATTADGLYSWDLNSDKGPHLWDKRKLLSHPTVATNGTAAVTSQQIPSGPPEILLVDLPTGTLRHTLELQGVQHVALSLDGRALAVGGVEKPIQLWDVATGKPGLTLRGNPKGSISSAFSPDGKWLASADGDGTVRVWNIKQD